jgi:hypothetical protein
VPARDRDNPFETSAWLDDVANHIVVTTEGPLVTPVQIALVGKRGPKIDSPLPVMPVQLGTSRGGISMRIADIRTTWRTPNGLGKTGVDLGAAGEKMFSGEWVELAPEQLSDLAHVLAEVEINGRRVDENDAPIERSNVTLGEIRQAAERSHGIQATTQDSSWGLID